ncbi:hypothetical protein DdX_03321 [Ditylenchus destructor]|uniref:BHLH domain-containing protein n=1 Tax=Ditylenchus destructor TaxID=166010 RepID=A0AAD4NG12_9BILA|nr:hypothetical protein DdX_03321 [Ditylenchus destructor]
MNQVLTSSAVFYNTCSSQDISSDYVAGISKISQPTMNTDKNFSVRRRAHKLHISSKKKQRTAVLEKLRNMVGAESCLSQLELMQRIIDYICNLQCALNNPTGPSLFNSTSQEHSEHEMINSPDTVHQLITQLTMLMKFKRVR